MSSLNMCILINVSNLMRRQLIRTPRRWSSLLHATAFHSQEDGLLFEHYYQCSVTMVTWRHDSYPVYSCSRCKNYGIQRFMCCRDWECMAKWWLFTNFFETKAAEVQFVVFGSLYRIYWWTIIALHSRLYVNGRRVWDLCNSRTVLHKHPSPSCSRWHKSVYQDGVWTRIYVEYEFMYDYGKRCSKM